MPKDHHKHEHKEGSDEEEDHKAEHKHHKPDHKHHDKKHHKDHEKKHHKKHHHKHKHDHKHHKHHKSDESWESGSKSGSGSGGEEYVAPPAPAEPKIEDLAIDEPEPEEAEEQEAADKTEGKKPSKFASKPTKGKFGSTLFFGGEGGGEFDHGNHRSIKSISVRAGKVVDGITVKYNDGEFSSGGEGGGEETLTLQKGEYINKVQLRSNKLVQCLTFETNKGNKLGPCGGTGAFGIDKCGEEHEAKAPPNSQLCGIKGRGGKYLDAIAFRWGPIPTPK